MTTGKSLAPWLLFLEQESYLSCINLNGIRTNAPLRKIAPRLGLGFGSRSRLMKRHEMSDDNTILSFTETEHAIIHLFLKFLN